jgi:hypothetical protein
LQAVLALYIRPAILAHALDKVPLWKEVQEQRSSIEAVLRGVGRIEVLGHDEIEWAGTGFLVHERCLMTTRSVAQGFLDHCGDRWQFRPGVTAWVDYEIETQPTASAGFRIVGVLGIHEDHNLALFEIEDSQPSQWSPRPLVLAGTTVDMTRGRPVYLVGFPLRDHRRVEEPTLAHFFHQVYRVKRIHPGRLIEPVPLQERPIFGHDCGMFGTLQGSCIVDFETHQVLGLHLGSRYLGSGTALALWHLRDDPLLRSAGLTFSDVTPADLQSRLAQVQHLASTRKWPELSAALDKLIE